mgnify:CR=1 FL=1|jgi:hypothetical protein
MKKMLLTALVSAVALGTVGIGFTMAQDAVLTDTQVAITDTVLATETDTDEGCPFGKDRGDRPRSEEMIEHKAEILNLTAEELQAKVDEGKTFIDIAEEQGVTYTDIQEAMNSHFEEQLQAKIDSGYLTQEQADEFREQHEEKSGMMHGMGFGKGGGMHRGGMHL